MIHVDLTRFENKIKEYERYPKTEDGVLLYGSSFFANWQYERANTQMKKASNGSINVVNHGFGGATTDELLYYYNRMVLPYKPKAMIWRGGPNDIFNGLSPYEAWLISERVFEWAKIDFPNIRIGILCIFDYKSSALKDRPLFAEYDKYAQEYSEKNSHVSFIDINDFFYEKEHDIGSFCNFRNIFVEDGLHLTDKAYEEFANYFCNKLYTLLPE